MNERSRPRISVCVVTRNQAAYIQDCVMGVLSQAPDVELEVLVGDDESDDATPAMLAQLAQRYPGQLQVLRREPRLGPTENYLDLIGRASGDFIAHLDGDDAWLPGKLRKQVAFLEAHPECVAVYTDAVVLDFEGRLRGAFTTTHPPVIDAAYLCARGNFLNHSSLLYRASAKATLLALEPPFLDFMIPVSLLPAGRIGYLDEALTVYRSGTATSAVRTVPEMVTRLYWDALSKGLSHLRPDERRAAVSHQVAAAIVDGLMTRDLDGARARIRRTLTACEGARTRVAAAAAARAGGLLIKGVAARLGKTMSGHRLSVLNPRR